MNITHEDLTPKQESQESHVILHPERFIQNTDKYNALMMMYRCAIREISTKPISSIKSRIKQPESIYRKLQKKGCDFTEKNIREQLNDVAGIRVTCPFIDDIYIVAKLLAEQDDITVLRIKDYIQNPKENGYRSYHMIVEIPVFFAEGKTPMRAEVQIRTIGMDFWASLEHQLRYKKELGDNAQYEFISQKLSECAHAITSTDNQMQDIKNMIGEYTDL